MYSPPRTYTHFYIFMAYKFKMANHQTLLGTFYYEAVLYNDFLFFFHSYVSYYP